MKHQLKILTGIFLLASLHAAWGQEDEKSGKITVEITKEINGEKKTFKGEYENEEQMKADPNYQEFAGEEDNFNIWFDGDDGSNIKLWIDRFQDDASSYFKFDMDSDDNPKFFFKGFDGDSANVLRLHDFAATDWSKHLKDLGVNLDALMLKLDDENLGIHKHASKRIRVMELEGNEFGKRGKAEKSELLTLEKLSFTPNPSSNGKINIRFEVPSEDELTIKVFNLNDKEVFNRYFERFGGTYSESIDLSGQKEGMYLLEIKHGRKRLTRKILIN